MPPTPKAEPRASRDRYAEMNDVLDQCVADVKKRIGKFTFSEPQIAAMVAEAVNAKVHRLREAATAAVTSAVS